MEVLNAFQSGGRAVRSVIASLAALPVAGGAVAFGLPCSGDQEEV